MKFTIYKLTGEADEHRVFLEQSDSEALDVLVLPQVSEISNYPEISQMEGIRKEKHSDKGWLTYHENIMANNYTLVDKGDYEVMEVNDKFSKIEFVSDLGKVSGNWIIRNGNDDRILLWKPLQFNDKFACACKSQVKEGNDVKVIDDKFGYPVTINEKGIFKGTMMSAGVYTGQAGIPVLYTNDLINRIYEKYKDSPSKIKVDFDHDEVIAGELDSIKKVNTPVERLVVTGKATKSIVPKSGLSIWARNQVVWDSELQVHVIVDSDINTVSIIENGKPNCSICYIE